MRRFGARWQLGPTTALMIASQRGQGFLNGSPEPGHGGTRQQQPPGRHGNFHEYRPLSWKL
jgi:hypothetical protein